MGIRTFLSRTAPGGALPPVPAFEAAASTVRIPVTFTTALRHATADLRQHLSTRGRRPTGSAGTGDLTTAPALADIEALSALIGRTGTDAPSVLTGLVGTDVMSALTGLADTDALSALIGAGTLPTGTDPPAVTGHAPTEARPTGTRGKSSRPWARLARDYLTLVLTLLPRPRPAHTTITVYITTTDSALSERPGGSAPSRRQGQDRRGPEPDAAP
ncbi:hypothetical protein G3I77_05050 [Streptomyces sp. D2-8]|uniref:hypothetical protein n=1 Tax=Streptomyces sp. D2-8 TaxID=2707767 RepID=UPI0020BFA51F|nr:hypothetical protein [Streptomyces sp. D2-8]MCK8432424.1 hypothetical protein [Streptomyces sp. D2-8]